MPNQRADPKHWKAARNPRYVTTAVGSSAPAPTPPTAAILEDQSATPTPVKTAPATTQGKSPDPAPTEAHRGSSDPSRTSPTDPPPPPELMTARWTKTWGKLFHGGRAASTKQAQPETNLVLMPPTKSETKTPRPPSSQQQKMTTLTDGPGGTVGSKISHHEVTVATTCRSQTARFDSGTSPANPKLLYQELASIAIIHTGLPNPPVPLPLRHRRGRRRRGGTGENGAGTVVASGSPLWNCSWRRGTRETKELDYVIYSALLIVFDSVLSF